MSTEEDATRQNWSSTFVRNRTEVVSVAVVIFIATRLGLDFKKIPVLGIELSHDAPRGILLLGIYLFFFYFVACWCLRFKVEVKGSGLPKDYLATALNSVSEELSRVKSVTVPNWKQQIQNLRDQWQDTMTPLLEQYRQGAKIDLQSWFETNARVRVGIEETEQLESFKSQLAAYEARMLQARVSNVEAIERAVDLGGATLDDLQVQAISALEATSPQVEKSLVAIRTHITNLTADIRQFRSALAWDKVIFGFWIPLIAAILIVATSTPQALLDVAPTLKGLPTCISQVGQCLYRENKDAVPSAM